MKGNNCHSSSPLQREVREEKGVTAKLKIKKPQIVLLEKHNVSGLENTFSKVLAGLAINKFQEKYTLYICIFLQLVCISDTLFKWVSPALIRHII